MKDKRRKILVGWTYTKWRLKYSHKQVNSRMVRVPPIYPTKKDACDWLRLPDREYKPVKIKLTMEEL